MRDQNERIASDTIASTFVKYLIDWLADQRCIAVGQVRRVTRLTPLRHGTFTSRYHRIGITPVQRLDSPADHGEARIGVPRFNGEAASPNPLAVHGVLAAYKFNIGRPT